MVARLLWEQDAAGSNPVIRTIYYAELAKLADALDLGSSVEKHKGSSPLFRTIYSLIVQSVERMTVNHHVVGSSPTQRAIIAAVAQR